tara:strand:- start:20 stop:238 length:219 start_codon:yes stop_codon:yes gene_type:complete
MKISKILMLSDTPYIILNNLNGVNGKLETITPKDKIHFEALYFSINQKLKENREEFKELKAIKKKLNELEIK